MRQKIKDIIVLVELHLILYQLCVIGYFLLLAHSAFYTFPPDLSTHVMAPLYQYYIYGFIIYVVLEFIILINNYTLRLNGGKSRKS